MIRVALTPIQHDDLRARTRDPGVGPRTRDRLEMIRLADAGWTIPRIARHLGAHEQTVRKYVKAFLAEGFDALPDRPRPGRPPTVIEAHLDALEALLDTGERTWTTPQLVAWLAQEHGVRVHPDHLSRLLHARRFGWKRTVSSVAHKRRDPDGYDAKVGELDGLKKAAAGVIDLWFLDQSGFCPTLPTGYGWGRLGRRLVVPYEAPQGRRVNVVGALAPYDPAGPRLLYETRRKADGRYDAAAHLAFVRRVAGEGAERRTRPCVVVLDNYAVHHSHAVKDDLPSLTAADIHFCFLPPYSPELNPIEPVWRHAKHHDIPERSHPTDTDLQAAVESALATRAHRLAQLTTNLPRPA